MKPRRNPTLRALLLAGIVAGVAPLTGCTPRVAALTPDGKAARQGSSSAASACTQQESAARSAALEATHVGGAAGGESPEAAMAASMAQSRAAIAENEYRNCLVSH
jgi:hypothetical protein